MSSQESMDASTRTARGLAQADEGRGDFRFLWGAGTGLLGAAAERLGRVGRASRAEEHLRCLVDHAEEKSTFPPRYRAAGTVRTWLWRRELRRTVTTGVAAGVQGRGRSGMGA